ncbi:DUF6766 family protein [Pedobacter ginsengiterrae]|uniref:DUF6766 family protein n=1 Tax=Pedobacter ginsengiterrae TaxID=871696 RepID=UPI003CD0ABC4
MEYLQEPTLCSDAFQNPQREFLSVAAILILTDFLRRKKTFLFPRPVDGLNMETAN